LKVKIQLVTPTGTEPHTIEIKKPYKGPRLLDQIDKEVNRLFHDRTDWTRWNLREILD
jgi:hypothetical protein